MAPNWKRRIRESVGQEIERKEVNTSSNTSCTIATSNTEPSLPAIMVWPTTAQDRGTVILQHQYDTYRIPSLPGSPSLRDGSKIRVVLTQIVGELWSLFVGQEDVAREYMSSGVPGILLEASYETSWWGEWDGLRGDDVIVNAWESSLSFGYVVYYLLERKGGDAIPVGSIMIPRENVTIRRKP